MTAATPMLGTDHYIYRRDGKVYVHKVGGGEPVIFLHAVGLSGWTWRHSIDQFARHFTCYNIDLPGYDRSDTPPRQYSMNDFADSVLDVLDGLGLERASIVADHTGSIIAGIVAGKHPKRVHRMVLDGLPYWSRLTGEMIWEKFFLPNYTDTTSYHIPVEPLTTWEQFHEKTPNFDREFWAKHEEINQRSRLWHRLSQEANAKFDVEALGPTVKTPTLLLYGDGDPLRRRGEKANNGIRGSILQVVEGAPGPAHMFQPDEFAKLSIAFLSDPLKQ